MISNRRPLTRSPLFHLLPFLLFHRLFAAQELVTLYVRVYPQHPDTTQNADSLHMWYNVATMQENIKAAIKAAMIAKDSVRLGTLRLVSAAFTNELVTQGRPPQEPLSDEDCMKVLKRMAKQRKDSIQQFIDGGRPELADDEKAELAVIEAMLPTAMSEADIEARIAAKLAESPLDPAKKGQFVGMMMKELGDTADGATVKAVIDRLTA